MITLNTVIASRRQVVGWGHLLLAGIIDPCNTEGEHALRLDQALHDGDQLGVLREDRLHGGQHLLHRLKQTRQLSVQWPTYIAQPHNMHRRHKQPEATQGQGGPEPYNNITLVSTG